ncbi:MAG: hypothetical protein ACK56I_12460, partial [bacterium]
MALSVCVPRGTRPRRRTAARAAGRASRAKSVPAEPLAGKDRAAASLSERLRPPRPPSRAPGLSPLRRPPGP